MRTGSCAIRLLGEPSCIAGDVVRRIGGPPRALVLLLFLALHPGEPLERRQLAFRLWPDDDAETALANLRRHLHALATTLPRRPGGRPWFETSRVSVRWNGGAEVDVTAFEEAVNRGDDATAVAVYRGPLCAGIDEEWADRDRERLARLALEALDRLVERDRTSDPQRAIAWANRALAIDPWCESATRALIELQSAAGDAASARRTYREFARRLMRELGAEPAAETTGAYQRIARRPSRPRGNLPQEVPALIGRTRELADVVELIRSERLVTLVGYGGIGKTRVAIAAGLALAGDVADGVHLCELVSIADPELVASTIATAAGIAQAGSSDIAATIGADFGDRLLIIDNFEHLLDETARVVDVILRSAPHARILTTGREPLRLRGERVVRLEPLAPDEAIELFAVRAEAANPRFRRSPDVLPAVADVCRRLDGNALAIELAAARLNVLSVERIRSQLDTRFELLINGKRDVARHHRALRASLDWSYDLLTERERAMFAQLGVFAGVFSLDAAASLCSDRSANDVIEMLDALVEKSLLVAVGEGDAPRFRLLESVRLYARSRLEDAGLSDFMRSRHLATIGAAFGAVADAFAAAPRESLLLEVAPLLDDARVALDWALRSNLADLALGVRILCGTKLWDWLQLGPEALGYADALLMRLDGRDIELESELWRFVSFMDDRWVMSAHGVNAGDRAVALARESGNADLLARALAQRAYVAIRYRRLAEAAHDLEEAEALTPLTEARRLLIVAGRAFLATLEGRLDDALRDNLIVLETHRFLGNRTGERYATANIAELEHARGETRRAIDILRPFIAGEDGRELHDTMRRNLVGYHLAIDEIEAARDHAAEAIAQLPRTGKATVREAMLFEHIALIAAVDGAIVTAARMSAYVDAQFLAHGLPREHTEEVVNDKLRAAIDAQLDPPERAAAETEGRSWSRDRTIYEAARITGAPVHEATGFASMREPEQSRRRV